MNILRMPFHAAPGKTTKVEQRLKRLKQMIEEAGGSWVVIPTTCDKFGNDRLPAGVSFGNHTELLIASTPGYLRLGQQCRQGRDRG